MGDGFNSLLGENGFNSLLQGNGKNATLEQYKTYRKLLKDNKIKIDEFFTQNPDLSEYLEELYREDEDEDHLNEAFDKLIINKCEVFPSNKEPEVVVLNGNGSVNIIKEPIEPLEKETRGDFKIPTINLNGLELSLIFNDDCRWVSSSYGYVTVGIIVKISYNHDLCLEDYNEVEVEGVDDIMKLTTSINEAKDKLINCKELIKLSDGIIRLIIN